MQQAEAATARDLYARRKQAWNDWLAQARLFYKNLLAHPEWVTALAAYGQTETGLQEGLALVEAAEVTGNAQQVETGEARSATLERDVALDTLDDWMGDFRTVARIAFADDPRQLDKLGF